MDEHPAAPAAINRDQLAFNQASVGRHCDDMIQRRGKQQGRCSANP